MGEPFSSFRAGMMIDAANHVAMLKVNAPLRVVAGVPINAFFRLDKPSTPPANLASPG